MAFRAESWRTAPSEGDRRLFTRSMQGPVSGPRSQPGRDAEQRDGGGDARAGGAAGAARPLRAHGRRRRRLRHRPHHHLQAGQGDRQGLGQADGRAALGRALLRGDGHADRGEGRAGCRAGGSAPAGRDARGRLLLLRPRAGARTHLLPRQRGRGGGDRGPDRGRQDHPDRPADALLRSRLRPHLVRRSRSAPGPARQPARADRGGGPGAVPVRRLDP